MLKDLFKKKLPLEIINTHEADVALRLMFEIAISDGTLDSSELKLIKERANKIASKILVSLLMFIISLISQIYFRMHYFV